MHAKNQEWNEQRLGMTITEYNVAVKRAHRLGFEGEQVEQFIHLTPEEQKQVCAAKWRLEGQPALDIPEMVEKDMTPLEYYRSLATDIAARTLRGRRWFGQFPEDA